MSHVSMSFRWRTCAAALALVLTQAVQAAPVVVYDNSAEDQLFSVFFSTGNDQLGDRVQLSAPSRVDRVETQFYNAGDDAEFNATLRFYAADSATPTQIGSDFLAAGLAIGAGESLTVGFDNLGLLALPVDLIVMFSVQAVGGDGDIGLNFFGGGTVGNSDPGSFFADDGSGLAQAFTLLDIDNIYLRVVGTPLTVPEPGVAWLVLLPLGALVWRFPGVRTTPLAARMPALPRG